MSRRPGRRRAGLMVPLFSCPSSSSWGIGEIGDIAPLARWLAAAGHRVLQLLPLNEMARGQQSPYSAITAMAIDPIFIRVADVPELARQGAERSLTAAERATLEAARVSPRVPYASVRALKDSALAAAFDAFDAREWRADTSRARELTAFVRRESWWLDDYALFRALRVREDGRAWPEWPGPLRWRDREALDSARQELAREIRFYQYLQWIADTQWRAARAEARTWGVEIFGDLPFMVDGDSADVWSRPHQFRTDVSLGVPPDAFSATGQDWGMPTCNWDEMAADGYRWLRDRARRSADLYDGYRVDHLVGFYRTYGRSREGGEAFFSPAEVGDQEALGERVLGLLRDAGAEIIAEDLGTVPDFVRQSLARLGVPGFRVLRWEREWHVDGQPFRDPAEYPPTSVAASGTHDTEPMAVWWDRTTAEERRKIGELPTVRRLTHGAELDEASYSPAVRDVLLEALFASGSDLVLNVIQDVFGWSDRINEPATVGDGNWTFRLPWPCDLLGEVAEARERQAALIEWTRRYKRLDE